ncbi:WXG100 family type VII secretion target [Nocardia sp. NPDC059764]|uniref:WXG100 family type VII secretion target n=1 Tax=Nocardia sp. NPDC059764 TaxID=3346939 RepID=UPI00365200ED
MVANEAELAKAAQSHMADVVASIKDVLRKITETVDNSRTGFAGQAAEAFKSAADAWDTEAQNLNKAMDEFQEKVGAGTDVFSNVDITNEDAFKAALTNLG